jgi:hypothetical protein
MLSRPRINHFQGNVFALVSTYCTAKGLSIVGINPCVLPGAADRHVELLSIDKLGAAHRIDVHDHAVNGGALGGMRGGGIAIVHVPQFREIDAKLAMIVESELGLCGAELNYGREFPVGDLVLLVMDAELQAIANGQLAMLPGINLHAVPFCRVDPELPAVACPEG